METTGDSEIGRTPVASRTKPVHWLAGRTHQVLDDLGDPAAWALTSAERRETIVELVALKDRIDALLLEVVAQSDHADDATTHGATSTAALIRGATRLTQTDASRMVRHAKTLGAHEALGDALAAGAIRRDQALAIAAAVDGLPDEVADRRHRAERHLLAEAQTHDAKALRALGKYLLEVIAPEQADVLIGAQLEREEREAARTSYLKTWSDGHGSRFGRFKIPELHGVILDTLLATLTDPARPTRADAGDKERPATPDPLKPDPASPQIYGQAFGELIERYPTDQLPDLGGGPACVVVTMTLETLEGRLQAGGILGTDHRLSPGQVRRLACQAGVIPVVVGGKSEILDLGRKRRYHTRPQRLAMALRQGGRCNITGCHRPTKRSHAHHRRAAWAKGGNTSVDDGELICRRHHTLVHQGFDYPRRT